MLHILYNDCKYDFMSEVKVNIKEDSHICDNVCLRCVDDQEIICVPGMALESKVNAK